MPSTNSQTILIYGSQTPGAVPSANNLVTSGSGVELALNAADGKLFYKDISGVVRVLADARFSGGSSYDVVGGTINATPIGNTIPSSGVFTTVGVTSLTVASVNGLMKSAGAGGVVAATPGVDYLDPASKGVALGVASLDASGKVPSAQLPSSIVGTLHYAGTWDAATNTPTLSSGVGVPRSYYVVSNPGTTNLNGVNSWVAGDLAIFDGMVWEKVSNVSAPVQSVNGQTGAVTITRASLGAAAAGANSDITSLSGLTTALSVSQGGTGRVTLSGILKGNGTDGIVAAMPGVDYAPATLGSVNQLLANNGSGGFANVTIGAGLTYSGGVLAATGAVTGGTVTSVNVSGGTTGLTFSGGPILNSGTISMGGTLAVANGGTGATTKQAAMNSFAGGTQAGWFLRGNGSDVVMSQIQVSDVPILNQNTTGSALVVTRPEQPAITSVGTLTSLSVAGTVALSGSMMLGASFGTTGQVLTSNGPGQPLTWTTPSSVPVNVGTVTSVNVSGGTTGLTTSGGPVSTAGTIILDGVLAIAHGGTGTSSATGAGSVVLADGPVLNSAQIVNGFANNMVIGNTVPAPAAFTTINAASVSATSMTVTGEATFTAVTALRLPVGATADRPMPSVGKVRFNTTTGLYEGAYPGGIWGPLTGEQDDQPEYSLITADYTAANGDYLSVDTSANPIIVNVPSPPVDGIWFKIVDAADFGINKLTLGRNGATINGNNTDLDITASGIELLVFYTKGTWRVRASTYANTLPATGLGGPVLAVSPTLVEPNLGTPVAVDLANAVNLPLATGVSGILPVAHGGTGAATLTGLVKGTGASAMVAATPGVDYAAATTGTAAQLLANNGSGGFSNVTVGTGLSMVSGVLTNTGGTGTVTSVNMTGGPTGLTFVGGPITTAGAMALSGTLLPAHGGTGATTLTGLVKGNGTAAMTAAVPGVDYLPAATGTAAQLLANNGSGGLVNVTLGSGLFYSGGILSSVSGTGTVTSIAASGGTTGLSFTGGPITTFGTVTLGGTLNPTSGGTGATSLTGLVKGNGTAPMTAAVAGVDYAAAPTGSVNQLLANNGSGGFANVTLGVGLAVSGGVLNVTGMGPGGGVTSFAGRQGGVEPEAGDYSADKVTAVSTTFNVGTDVGTQLSALGSSAGATKIGYTQAGAGTIARSVASRLNEDISVANYSGCDTTGASTSLSAFAAAYADAQPGQQILIPAGRYLNVSGVLTGTKQVTWKAYGYPIGATAWDLPGTVIQYGDSVVTSPVVRIKGDASLNSNGVEVKRTASFIGGIGVNSALSVSTDVLIGATTNERALSVALMSGASSDAVAASVRVTKAGTGGVVGSDATVVDQGTAPTADAVAVSVTVAATGSDTNDKRVGLRVLAAQATPGVAEVGNGIQIGSAGGDTTAYFKNGVSLVGKFSGSMLNLNNTAGVAANGLSILGTITTGINVATSGTTGIRVAGSVATGIDLTAGAYTDVAIRLKSGDKIALNPTGHLNYSAGNGGVAYGVSGVTKHVLRDNGDLFMVGKLAFTSATASSTTAGSASGKYLVLTIDGNPYKVALLDN